MKKLSVLFAAIIVLTLAGYGAGTAKAAPPIDRHQLNASQCSGGTLVVNVTQQVLNDIDSGYFGYWAQDNYTRQIQIWQLTENTFCVLARYEGGFVTFGGSALSPGAGAPLAPGITGTMVGGYNGTLTGTLKSNPAFATSGNIGTFDYGCAQSGSCTGRVNLFAEYFDSGYSFAYNYWGWVYRSGHGSTWTNAIDVPQPNSGDITE